MGSQAAKVMTERVGGASWKPAVVGGTAHKAPELKVVDPTVALRASVVERLQKDTAEFLSRMTTFLESPGRTGIANVSLVISESTLTQELWKEPRQSSEAREQLAHSLSLGTDVDDATLLQALMAQVHEAFGEFENSPAGREFRMRYDALLYSYDAMGVLPVLLGHDVGPLVGELSQRGVECEEDFARSILLDPRVLAVVPPSDELVDARVLVSGVSVGQLGSVVVQMRQFNPVLTNRQVRNFVSRAVTDGQFRKSLGRAEMDQLMDWSRQILRLQAVGRLVP